MRPELCSVWRSSRWVNKLFVIKVSIMLVLRCWISFYLMLLLSSQVITVSEGAQGTLTFLAHPCKLAALQEAF